MYTLCIRTPTTVQDTFIFFYPIIFTIRLGGKKNETKKVSTDECIFLIFAGIPFINVAENPAFCTELSDRNLTYSLFVLE